MREKIHIVIGLVFVLIGILCNQWVLAVLFSPDGVLELVTKAKILAFELVLIALGFNFIIFRKSFLLDKISLVLLSPVLAILMIEIFIFYVFDIKAPGYKPDRFFQYSELTGHFHKPNSEGYWYRYNDGTKFYVKINSYGFADSERKIQKTRPRIALLGDSTIEFWETDQKHRGQYVIEALTNNRFEVLNFGVRGYGTDQTYILFKNVGVHFSPDIVIYTFCINDVHDNSVTESKPYFIIDPTQPDGLLLQGYPIKKLPTNTKTNSFSMREYSDRFLLKSSFFYRNSSHLRRLIGHHKSTQLKDHFELRPYKKIYNEEDSLRMKITLRIISLLNNFVKARNMKLLVVEGVYNSVLDEQERNEIIKKYGDIFDFDKVSITLKEHCDKNGIEFLSLPSIIKDQKLFFSDFFHKRDESMHFNKHGILFYANSVIDKLRLLNWLDK